MKRLGPVWAVMVCLAAGLAAGESQGQNEDKKKKNKQEAVVSSPSVQVQIRFSLEDENVIRSWFSDEGNLSGLPPGLAKREELPPGLQKHLVRNGTLPPGLQKKVQPLPPDLENRLPPPPEGVVRVVLSGRVILLGEKTSTILDLLEHVY